MIGTVLCGAPRLIATGAVGAVAYDGVKKLMRVSVFHGAAVSVTSWGLRGARLAETGAEKARLTTADIVSEAREKVGERSLPPGGGGGAHNHEH